LPGTAIEHDFVAAEDQSGKPDPSIYRRIGDRLNAGRACFDQISPAECLVIEDSLTGIQSPRAAGMRLLGLDATYPLEILGEADNGWPSLVGISPKAAISRLA
jgi:beta-phosphoglucomutase-like phosphatase (HAD superfamily)